MLERSDLVMVMSVRDHGRIAGAAEHLGISPAAVTKRLGAIEKKLGVKLFQRTTRRLSITDEGQLCVALAAQVLERFEDLEAQVTSRSQSALGRLRVVANPGFGRKHLAPCVARFQEEHGQIAVEVHLTNTLPDLQAEGFDAAVWLWGPVSQRWVSTKLASNHRVVVASPQYLRRHGAPSEPADLQRHQCITMTQRDRFGPMWRLQPLEPRARTGGVEVQVKGPLSTNFGSVALDWALAGRGIALRPLWEVADDLRSGQLVDVLPGLGQVDSDVQWLAPFRANPPRRLVLLKQWLRQAFARPPWAS
jgi:LysR family transcriptional regulator, transcriptional activator for dmlA